MNKANGPKSNDFLFSTLLSGGGVRPHRHPLWQRACKAAAIAIVSWLDFSFRFGMYLEPVPARHAHSAARTCRLCLWQKRLPFLHRRLLCCTSCSPDGTCPSRDTATWTPGGHESLARVLQSWNGMEFRICAWLVTSNLSISHETAFRRVPSAVQPTFESPWHIFPAWHTSYPGCPLPCFSHRLDFCNVNKKNTGKKVKQRKDSLLPFIEHAAELWQQTVQWRWSNLCWSGWWLSNTFPVRSKRCPADCVALPASRAGCSLPALISFPASSESYGLSSGSRNTGQLFGLYNYELWIMLGMLYEPLTRFQTMRHGNCWIVRLICCIHRDGRPCIPTFFNQLEVLHNERHPSSPSGATFRFTLLLLSFETALLHPELTTFIQVFKLTLAHRTNTIGELLCFVPSFCWEKFTQTASTWRRIQQRKAQTCNLNCLALFCLCGFFFLLFWSTDTQD